MKMKISVLESLRAFIKAHPPVVAFTFSLVAIDVAIFLVAFYVKDTNLILDLHAQEDWNDFLTLLSSQKFCMNSSSFENPARSNSFDEFQPLHRAEQQNSTFLPAKINQIKLNNSLLLNESTAVIFTGLINIKELSKSCTREKKLYSNKKSMLDIRLIIPSPSEESSDGFTSCVFLSGLPDLLPDVSFLNSFYSFHHEQCKALDLSPKIVRKIVPYESKDEDAVSLCYPGDMLQLSYDSTSYEPKAYLTEGDKLHIFSNLLFSGYLLLAAISVILLTAVLQGRNLLLTSQHTLIPTKETIT